MRSRQNNFLKVSQGLLASSAGYALHDALIADTEYSKDRIKTKDSQSSQAGYWDFGGRIRKLILARSGENPPSLPWHRLSGPR